MSFYRVKMARFAETIRVGDHGEELRYISMDEKKYERYTMTYHDNLLWIHDQKTNIVYTTSNANLRVMIMADFPSKALPDKKSTKEKE